MWENCPRSWICGDIFGGGCDSSTNSHGSAEKHMYMYIYECVCVLYIYIISYILIKQYPDKMLSVGWGIYRCILYYLCDFEEIKKFF